MGAVWLRFRAELRTRWRGWLGAAALVGLAAGAVMSLTAGARRTDSAYSRFLYAQNAYDVMIAQDRQLFSGTIAPASFDADELRRLPEVVDVHKAGSFFVFVGAGVGVMVPPDERIGTEVNRFKMLEGRRPDPGDPSEVVVSFTFAEQYDLGVGSKIPLPVPESVPVEVPPDLTPEEFQAALAARQRILEVLPDNAFTVVGVEASPGEFPPQIEGTGRYLIHASPALHPQWLDLGLFGEASDLLMVRLERGADDVDAFLDEIRRLGGGAEPTLVIQHQLSASVDRSINTQATALLVLAALTALVGALVVGQLLARLTFLESSEHPVLSAVGMTRAQLVGLGLARAGVIGVAGGLLAVVLAYAASPLFPTGLARTAEPDVGPRLDAFVLGLGGGCVVVALVLLAVWPAWRAGRAVAGVELASPRSSAVGRLLARPGLPVPVSTGVWMALEPGRGRSAVPVRSSLVAVTLGVASLVAALTFAVSLQHLLGTPRLYGQTWDVALTTYDETLPTRGLPVLAGDDRVDGVAVGQLGAGLEVEGRRVDALVLDTVDGDVAPVILEGRRPRAGDEIALGTRTLRLLAVDLGDTVEVGPLATDSDPVPMRVVARAVFPIFDEAGQLGDGAFISQAGGDRVAGRPIEPAQKGVLVRLSPGADIEALVEDVGAQLESFVFVIGQGRPTDNVSFGRVESTPYILGGILAALSVATLTHLLASAVRRRRRELAILKTLGFVSGQVRATVAWQATTLVVCSLVVGLPVGLAAGRWVWTRFADGLGVVPEPRVPWLAIALLVPAAVLVANTVAAVVAAVAARTRPALVLRSE